MGDEVIDVVPGSMHRFDHVLDRARWEQVGDQRIRVADAEGILFLKLLAFRPRDQEDIKGILTANPGRLDLDWVRHEWLQLSEKGDPKSNLFERLVREYYDPSDPSTDPAS